MIAKVNGDIITEADLKEEMQTVKCQMQASADVDQMPALIPMIRRRALNNLINRLLLIQAADKQNIQPSEEDIERKFREFAEQFPSDEAFDNQLKLWNVSRNYVRKSIAKELRMSMMLKRQTQKMGNSSKENIDQRRLLSKYLNKLKMQAEIIYAEDYEE